MNQEELAELLKYASPYSILVVTYYHKIITLKCPFKVRLKHNIGELQKEAFEMVDMVKLSTNLKTVFIIRNKAYYFHHFQIILD